MGSARQIAGDRRVAEFKEVGFVSALSATQQHVGFWNCDHGFGVFLGSRPPTNKGLVATAITSLVRSELEGAVATALAFSRGISDTATFAKRTFFSHSACRFSGRCSHIAAFASRRVRRMHVQLIHSDPLFGFMIGAHRFLTVDFIDSELVGDSEDGEQVADRDDGQRVHLGSEIFPVVARLRGVLRRMVNRLHRARV